MAVRPEVSVRLPNSPGALAWALETLADTRIAVEAWSMGNDATFRVVCDNPLLAVDVLGAQHPAVMRDVLTTVVPTRDVAKFLRRCARQGANLDYAYPGATGDAAGTFLVLGVADPARAAVVLGV
jgi:hypothetical protein